jgi:hypothetical protein
MVLSNLNVEIKNCETRVSNPDNPRDGLISIARPISFFCLQTKTEEKQMKFGLGILY